MLVSLSIRDVVLIERLDIPFEAFNQNHVCLLYTSDAADE